jgi:hypothetical protein
MFLVCVVALRRLGSRGDCALARLGIANFAEWGYLGKGKFQRRDFRFDVLTGSSKYSEEGSLFADLGKHEIFTPIRTYPPMTLRELAGLAEIT